MTKLGARDRAQLVVIAYEFGLVVPASPASGRRYCLGDRRSRCSIQASCSRASSAARARWRSARATARAAITPRTPSSASMHSHSHQRPPWNAYAQQMRVSPNSSPEMLHRQRQQRMTRIGFLELKPGVELAPAVSLLGREEFTAHGDRLRSTTRR